MDSVSDAQRFHNHGDVSFRLDIRQTSRLNICGISNLKLTCLNSSGIDLFNSGPNRTKNTPTTLSSNCRSGSLFRLRKEEGAIFSVGYCQNLATLAHFSNFTNTSFRTTKRRPLTDSRYISWGVQRKKYAHKNNFTGFNVR